MPITQVDQPRHIVNRLGLMLPTNKHLHRHRCSIQANDFIDTNRNLLIRKFL